jgi:hypothetical protein
LIVVAPGLLHSVPCLKPGEGVGVECTGGQANITEGYWPYFAADGRVRAVQCPPDLCAGGPALQARCASNRRLPVAENPLWYEFLASAVPSSANRSLVSHLVVRADVAARVRLAIPLAWAQRRAWRATACTVAT